MAPGHKLEAPRRRGGAGARVHIARRAGIGVALAAAVAGWIAAAYFLWQTVVPDGLELPDVEQTTLFPMLGLGLIWLLQRPFGLAELWWQRRHDVTEASYYEWVVGGWFGLGAEFLFVCLAILIVVGLAQVVGD